MKSGIYTIENLVNGKLYVGLTTDIEKRRKEHIIALNNKYHENSKLQNAWNKYGESNFRHEVLIECEEQYLFSEEHYWATLLNVHDDRYGYNIRPTHPYGKPRASEESKKRMSEAQKIAVNKPERIEQNRKRMMGKQYGLGHIITPEQRIKINEGQANKVITEDARHRWSKAATGRSHTPEARAKISEAHKGKKLTENQIEAIRQRNKGNQYGLGKKKSQETLEKIRKAKEKRKQEGWVTPLKGRSRPVEVVQKWLETKRQRSYKDLNKGIVRTNLRKVVLCYNVDNSFYMKFDSMKDALIHFGKKPDSTSHLKRALDDSSKIIYNKLWRYENKNNG